MSTADARSDSGTADARSDSGTADARSDSGTADARSNSGTADASNSGTPPGLRATRQRAAISALLENLDDFRSAQELHDELRRRGEGTGLTTVYRTLQSMAAAGLVDTLRTDTGESLYRRCSDHHHHHLVCRVCGCTVEVQGGQVETWAADVAREHGFSDVSHTIEIFGVCGGCAQAD